MTSRLLAAHQIWTGASASSGLDAINAVNAIAKTNNEPIIHVVGRAACSERDRLASVIHAF
jgi:hypothetical protein